MKSLNQLFDGLLAANVDVQKDKPLAPFTTIVTGGPARLLAVVKNAASLETAVKIAAQSGRSFQVLGKGSNVIIADSGFEGLVIINDSLQWRIIGKPPQPCRSSAVESRLQVIDFTQGKRKEHDNENEDAANVIVRVESGVKISKLINSLYREGITGLEWFAGIPATVGGAVYMNMHGGHKYFGDLVYEACLTDGKITKQVKNEYFQFDYDWSVLRRTKKIVLWVDLCLKFGNVEAARKISKKWVGNKANQPRKSAGCIFKNLSAEEQVTHNLPTPSVGYLIDKVLRLKGRRRGGAQISPGHAAFIENTGEATSADVFALINLILSEAKRRLGLELHLEVELIGKF